MKLYYLKVTLLRLGIMAVFYTFCRILFYLFNLNYFEEAAGMDILAAFLYGIRFDLSILFLLNALFFVLSLLPFPHLVEKKGYQQLLGCLYFPINLLFLYINLIDVEYFMFRGKRTTAEVLGIYQDIQAQTGQILLHYWHMVVIAILFTFALVKIYPRLQKNKPSVSLPKWYYYPILLIVTCIYFIVIRGGLQIKPIRPNQAFIFTPNVLGNLVLNTPFSLLHTLERTEIKKQYFYSDKDMERRLKSIKHGDFIHWKGTKPNVVVFILESFSSEYTGFGNSWEGYTPFLDSLSAHSIFCKNHLSNGSSSIEALPSVIASIPSLMPEPFITSMYQTNKITGMGEILKTHGYHTSFFHGATNGSMGFDVFARNAGFENYFGMDEYPDEKQGFDGAWGIYDHLFLDFFLEQIAAAPKPLATCIFTLSSHQPYPIPQTFRNKFPKGTIPIIESIGYVDHALKLFFNKAKKEPWFENTIFILTADHTQEKIRERNIFNDFHVPLLIYAPQLKPQIISHKITQHTDILPSVLDLLDMEEAYTLPFGTSIFDTSDAGRAINYDWGKEQTLLFHTDFITGIQPDGKIDFIKSPIPTDKENSLSENKKRDYGSELKFLLQYYNNGLIENNWVRR